MIVYIFQGGSKSKETREISILGSLQIISLCSSLIVPTKQALRTAKASATRAEEARTLEAEPSIIM